MMLLDMRMPPGRSSSAPENPLSPVVLDHLVLDVDLVTVPLAHREESVLPPRYTPVLDSVVAGDVPRVEAGVVGALDPARSGVATL